MDKNNPIIKLVQSGKVLEKDGKTKEAHDVFMQAWESASDDQEKCIAAHFVARNQNSSEEALKWNLEALAKADRFLNKEIKSYYPSLYLCVGISYENLKNYIDAKKYYELAFERISDLSKDKENETYNKEIIDNIVDRKNKIETKI